MRENDLENFLAHHPDIIEPGLVLIDRQHCIRRKRVDLLFRDARGRSLVVEVKIGLLCRADIGQLSEYCHYVQQRDAVRPRGMLVGTRVTDEIRGAAGFNGFECLALTLTRLEQHALEFHDQDMLSIVRMWRSSPADADEDEKAPSQSSPASWRAAAAPSGTVTGSATATVAMPRLSIADMLRSVLAGVEPGSLINGHDIISAVLDAFPNQTKKGSILLSDKCYNITNAGLSATYDFRMFEYISAGTYRYLGEGYPYSGHVTWKGERCGLWTEGVLEKWENWPLRRATDQRTAAA